MKTYIAVFSLLGVLVGISACKSNSFQEETAATKDTIIGSTQNAFAGTSANDTVRIANDSLEYEVIIIDAGFNMWLRSRAMQRGYYGEPYLRNKNTFWVQEWNLRYNNPQRYGDLYLTRIDYDPSINYGYEVNYLLYNYLVYFQQANNQRLGGVVPQN